MKFYMCDGKVTGCQKKWCYQHGGPCRHTTKKKHRRKIDGANTVTVGEDTWEMDDESMKEIMGCILGTKRKC